MSAIGTKRTFRIASAMSAFGGKADILPAHLDVPLLTQWTVGPPHAENRGLHLVNARLGGATGAQRAPHQSAFNREQEKITGLVLVVGGEWVVVDGTGLRFISETHPTPSKLRHYYLLRSLDGRKSSINWTSWRTRTTNNLVDPVCLTGNAHQIIESYQTDSNFTNGIC
jgi:hypothetical protein